MDESEVRIFLTSYTPPVQALVLNARLLVLALVPEAIEQLDSAAHLLAYGFDRTYKDTICVIMPLKAGVNLGFPRGVDLPDPTRLLAGTGKRARHVRLSEPGEVDNPALRALLIASIHLTRQFRRSPDLRPG